MKKISARLHIILARDADCGIIIRRGPSKQVCTIGWDLRSDTFKVGQWLKGRIYELDSDISPDGKYFIYFAAKGKLNELCYWIAISKIPYLKALNFYTKTARTAGGIFLDENHFWLDDSWGIDIIKEDLKELKRTEKIRKEPYDADAESLYYIRLQRDGWKLIERNTQNSLVIFDKDLEQGYLRKKCHVTLNHPTGKSYHYDEHAILDKNKKALIELPDWEWADLNKTNIAWASEGCLFRGRFVDGKITNSLKLKDFNDMRFEKLSAPY